LKRQSGTIYVLTLVSAIVLTSMAVGLSYLMLQFRRTSSTGGDIDRAYIHAEMGLRHAVHFVRTVPNWRIILSSGLWLSNISVDDATYSVTGTDPVDGNLANNSADPVILTCTATVNGVSRTVEVEIKQSQPDLFAGAVIAGGRIAIEGDARTNGDVFANKNIKKTGINSWIFGSAEAVGTIDETTNITGTISPGAEPKPVPAAETVIPDYQSQATVINYQEKLTGFTLSPTSNPFGPTPDPDGLYLIDCADQKIEISTCTIEGTLLLLNPGPRSEIKRTVYWQPARADYPALIVQGKITIGTDWFSNISGTIYVAGKLELKRQASVNGIIVATGDVKLKDDSQVTANPLWQMTPITHSGGSSPGSISGSWRYPTSP